MMCRTKLKQKITRNQDRHLILPEEEIQQHFPNMQITPTRSYANPRLAGLGKEPRLLLQELSMQQTLCSEQQTDVHTSLSHSDLSRFFTGSRCLPAPATKLWDLWAMLYSCRVVWLHGIGYFCCCFRLVFIFLFVLGGRGLFLFFFNCIIVAQVGFYFYFLVPWDRKVP